MCSVAIAGQAVAVIKSTKVPRYDAAVQKAVAFLQQLPSVSERDKSLVAYALLKAGVEKTHPRLAEGITLARQRANASNFDAYHGAYVAGVDAMLLADADSEGFRPEIQKIADRIVSFQGPGGMWNDPRDGPTGRGDVSLVRIVFWALGRTPSGLHN